MGACLAVPMALASMRLVTALRNPPRMPVAIAKPAGDKGKGKGNGKGKGKPEGQKKTKDGGKPPSGVTKAKPTEKERTQKMIEDARKAMGIDCVNHYNFAVCGQSGTGKSSFINAIRSIGDGQPGAAEVGVVETTQRVKKYGHPDMKHAFVYDLPGAGTTLHPSVTYFEDKKLYAFDCLFILFSDRFFDVDMKIAKSALEYQKRIAFVRTKADAAIKSLCQSNGLTAKEASTLFRSKVEESFKENLRRAGLSNQAHKLPLFIVSNAFYKRPTTYFIYDAEKGTLDNSLEKMDEDKIYEFMEASVEPRFHPCPCPCRH